MMTYFIACGQFGTASHQIYMFNICLYFNDIIKKVSKCQLKVLNNNYRDASTIINKMSAIIIK